MQDQSPPTPEAAADATWWIETDDGTVIPGGEAAAAYLVAKSNRRQAKLAKATPAQARAHARYYADQHKRHLSLTAAKRKQGHGDCSRELAAASRYAAGRLPVVAAAGHSNVLRFPTVRERRDRAGRSSAKSGDSGSDGPGETDPADWHWTQPDSSAGLIASVRSRDFERELHLERWTGRRA
jgi:hypothetical protein